MKKKNILKNKTKLRVFEELKSIGASTKSADAFIKKHKIGERKKK